MNQVNDNENYQNCKISGDSFLLRNFTVKLPFFGNVKLRKTAVTVPVQRKDC